MAKQIGPKIVPTKDPKKPKDPKDPKNPKKPEDGKKNMPWNKNWKGQKQNLPVDRTKPKSKPMPLSAKPSSFKMVPAKGAEKQNPARPAKAVGKPGVGRKSITSAPTVKKAPLANPSRVTKSPGKPMGMANKSSNVKSTFVRRPQGR